MEAWGIAGVVFAIIVTIVGFAFWMGRFAGKWGEKEKMLDGVRDDIDKIKSDISSIDIDIDKIKLDISSIRDKLTMLLSKDNVSITSCDSPIRLNARGQEIVEKVKAVEVVNAQIGSLRPMFTQITNSYDIQEKAMGLGQSIYEQLDDNSKDIVKKVAFDSGLPISEMFTIFSILLRDIIIKEKGDH